jgi:effector-binding domain-containing protein
MRHLITCAVVVCLGVLCVAAEPEKPGAKKETAKAAEYLVGEMHLQDLPEMNYVYGSSETTFDKMLDVINKYVPMITKGIEEGQLRSGGSAMFVYKGMTEDMSKPFTLEVGWCVPPNAKAFGELKVRKVKAARCATMLYTGSVANMSKVYEKLMPAIKAAGLAPAGDMREMYLYWENPESANNVIQVQVEVK